MNLPAPSWQKPALQIKIQSENSGKEEPPSGISIVNFPFIIIITIIAIIIIFIIIIIIIFITIIKLLPTQCAKKVKLCHFLYFSGCRINHED